ncbi:multiple coagulation factor deficiency protein 2 homolog [Centruroides vittatus]|uniref:multiple coagulation factor deficiency protein 2 homolog n=1 Tax=Centruroides vittatus TaxID=120091 RepID=UPI00350FD8D0
MSRVILLCFILLFLYQVTCFGTNEDDRQIEKPRKSKFFDFISDINHIKFDFMKILNIKNIGEITTDDAVFYFHKMHDYDGNNNLDGIELYQSFRHSWPNSENKLIRDENEISELIDSFLLFDENNDGMLTYAEYKKKWISTNNDN